MHLHDQAFENDRRLSWLYMGIVMAKSCSFKLVARFKRHYFDRRVFVVLLVRILGVIESRASNTALKRFWGYELITARDMLLHVVSKNTCDVLILFSCCNLMRSTLGFDCPVKFAKFAFVTYSSCGPRMSNWLAQPSKRKMPPLTTFEGSLSLLAASSCANSVLMINWRSSENDDKLSVAKEKTATLSLEEQCTWFQVCHSTGIQWATLAIRKGAWATSQSASSFDSICKSW